MVDSSAKDTDTISSNFPLKQPRFWRFSPVIIQMIMIVLFSADD